MDLRNDTREGTLDPERTPPAARGPACLYSSMPRHPEFMTSTVKVIHLDRSTDRAAEFIARNRTLSYEFVQAVDGTQLKSERIADPRLFEGDLPFPGPGAYGCALSHLAQWEFAIAHQAAVTIAEDDAIFRHDFEDASAAVMANLPHDWDIILWGWNFDSVLSVRALPGVSPAVMVFSQEMMRGNVDTFQSLSSPSHPYRLDNCFGIPAYSISPAGAARFRAWCFPMKNFKLHVPLLPAPVGNTGVDVAMNRVYAEANAYVAFPPLVITPNEAKTSTVQRDVARV